MQKESSALVIIFKDLVPNPKVLVFIIPIIILVLTFFVSSNYVGLLSINRSLNIDGQQKWLADSLGIYYFLMVIYIFSKYTLKGLSFDTKKFLISDYQEKIDRGDIEAINHPKLLSIFLLLLVLLNLVATFLFGDPKLEKFVDLYESIHSSNFIYFLFIFILNNLMLLFLFMSIYFMEIEK